MKEAIRDRWTEALRSGKYKQLVGRLSWGTAPEQEFCCLGVLCDLHSAETGEQWDGDAMYLLQNMGLPQEVLEWAGLPPNSNAVEVDLKVDSGTTTLAGLNDGGASFETIADIIEEEL